MSALAKIEATLDPIRTFMPDIGEDEYERRAKLRSFRDAATGMIALTRCDLARKLAWEAIEHSTPFLYAPSPSEGLASYCGPFPGASRALRLRTRPAPMNGSASS